MSSEIAIKVENLSKCYQIYAQPHDRLKQSIYPRLQRLAGKQPKQYFREFWALKDVSFEIKKGETVGIIGRNGSGKSTLLQMICGTLNPSGGSIQTHGRIAALLELGSGFNPEFTGRENVYMNAAVLGLSKEETDARFDDIVAFADIGDFIEQPVKTYSSGMMVRLAFAVIAHVDADILVIDEALAVGDAFFTQKCMRFIRQFQENGGTLLFVSHDTGTVINICQTAVMLFAGGQRSAVVGPAKILCDDYLKQIYDDSARQEHVERQRIQHDLPSQLQSVRSSKILKGVVAEVNKYVVSAFRLDAEHFGHGGAAIIDAGFFDGGGNPLRELAGGDAVCFVIRVHANKSISYPAVGLMIKDRLGQFLYTEGTDKSFRHHHLKFDVNEDIDVVFRFVMPVLIRGQYTINVAVAEGAGDDHIQHHWIHDAVKFESVSGPVVHGIGGLLVSDISMEFREC
jgi:lipopolysaccharide transport system ATP-binding protein